MRLWDALDGHVLAVLGSVSGQSAGCAVSTNPSAIDFVGSDPDAARAVPICRIGVRSSPFDLCAERFVIPGLLVRALARDLTLGDP